MDEKTWNDENKINKIWKEGALNAFGVPVVLILLLLGLSIWMVNFPHCRKDYAWGILGIGMSVFSMPFCLIPLCCGGKDGRRSIRTHLEITEKYNELQRRIKKLQPLALANPADMRHLIDAKEAMEEARVQRAQVKFDDDTPYQATRGCCNCAKTILEPLSRGLKESEVTASKL